MQFINNQPSCTVLKTGKIMTSLNQGGIVTWDIPGNKRAARSAKFFCSGVGLKCSKVEVFWGQLGMFWGQYTAK